MTPRTRDERRGDPSARGAAAGVAVALIAAFLTASLAPCPASGRAWVAHTEPAPESHAPGGATSLTAPCPCQCGEHAPVAGSSSHLGVALPSTAPDLAPRLAAKLAWIAAARFAAAFATPIDHIPLLV